MRLLLSALLMTTLSLQAQQAPFQVPLWPGPPPVCPRTGETDIYHDDNLGTLIRDVRQPLIEVYLAPRPNPNAASVLICPGGGYYLLAWDWEGVEMARWYNEMGITAFVLRYRTPHFEQDSCRSRVALADAQQALRLVRSRATEWRIDPHRVAVMGFSAGGHLASTLGTQYDSGQPTATDPVARQSCRPDALILMYPVISSEPGVAHAGSFENLLGKTPSPAQLTRFSNDRQVTPDTPPTLLIHAADDDLVPAENSIRFYQALLRHHVPATMYLYPDGGHGFSFARHKTGPVTRWPQDCMAWLEWIGWK